MSGSTGYVPLPTPQVVNPLASIADANRAAYTAWANQEARANQAAGQAFLNSIDPATGQPNQAALMRNLAADPNTAMAAQVAAQRGQTLDANTYKLHTERLSQANDAIGSLIGRFPQGIPQDAAHAAIDQEVSTGLITPAEGEQLKTQFGTNPRQNTITASQIYQHNMNTSQQLDWNYGVPTTVQQGSQVGFGAVSPRGGGYTPSGSPMPIYPTVEQQTGVTYYTDLDPKSPTYAQQVPVTERDRRIAAGADPKLFGPPTTSPYANGGRYPTVPPAVQGPNPPAPPNQGGGQAAGGGGGGVKYKEGQTATNPQTGAKVVFRGGKWVPQ